MLKKPKQSDTQWSNIKNKLTNARWYKFMFFLYEQFFNDHCDQRASSLTYTTLLAIIPFITVIIVVISSMPVLESNRQQVYQLIYSSLLPASGLQIHTYVESFSQQFTNLTTIGVAGLFFTSIMMLITIENSFSEIWQVKKQTRWFTSITRYLLLLTIAPLLLTIIFTASTAINSVLFIEQKMTGLEQFSTLGVELFSYGVSVFGLFFLYSFVPRASVPLKNSLIAAAFVGVLFELLKHSFGVLITNFTSYQLIYGAFAALPVFLIWIYLSWILVLLGVEISFCLTMFNRQEKQPQPKLMIVITLLKAFDDAQRSGSSVHQNILRSIIYTQDSTSHFNYVSELCDKGYIKEVSQDRFVLNRKINSITIWELYQNLPYELPLKLLKKNANVLNLNDRKGIGFIDDYQYNVDEVFDEVMHTTEQILSISLSEIFHRTRIIEK